MQQAVYQITQLWSIPVILMPLSHLIRIASFVMEKVLPLVSCQVLLVYLILLFTKMLSILVPLKIQQMEFQVLYLPT